jgi:hypothetical protein
MAARQKASPFQSFTDLAREYVRLIVLVRKYSGVSAATIMKDTAGDLGLGQRRTEAIYYGYNERFVTGVTETEWVSVREKAAAILLKEAASLRRRANYLEAKAKEIHEQAPSRFNGGGLNAWLSAGADAGGSE